MSECSLVSNLGGHFRAQAGILANERYPRQAYSGIR